MYQVIFVFYCSNKMVHFHKDLFSAFRDAYRYLCRLREWTVRASRVTFPRLTLLRTKANDSLPTATISCGVGWCCKRYRDVLEWDDSSS